MKLVKARVAYIAIHCSATQPKSSLGVEDIDRWHKERGFFKVGYHYVIKTDGTVQTGRTLDEVGAHVQGFNSVSIGICMIGGIDRKGKSVNNFTDEQFVALGTLVTQLKEEYPDAVVQGHRDFPNVAKDCPCFDVKQWYRETVENTEYTDPIEKSEVPAILKSQE